MDAEPADIKKTAIFHEFSNLHIIHQSHKSHWLKLSICDNINYIAFELRRIYRSGPLLAPSSSEARFSDELGFLSLIKTFNFAQKAVPHNALLTGKRPHSATEVVIS